MALIEHAFSWTFMIMLPVMGKLIYKNILFENAILAFMVVFIINWFVHGVIDNCKANLKNINLITDQLIHVTQIIVTWLIFFGFPVWVD